MNQKKEWTTMVHTAGGNNPTVDMAYALTQSAFPDAVQASLVYAI